MQHRMLVRGLLAIAILGLTSMAHAQAPKAKAKAKAKQQQQRVPEGVKVERDLEYARVGDKVLRLDIYRPESERQALPLIIWIHGGGWRAGSKENSPVIPLSGRGFVVASINYRLTNVASFPAQIEDCRAAIRWLRANASKYGIDPKRVGVWGASAGGHLVALLGTSGDVDQWDTVGGDRDQSARVQAVCDYYGPVEFLLGTYPANDRGAASPVGRLLGGPVDERKDVARQASPLTYINADDPPVLIVHGDLDKTVSIKQAEMFEEALKKAGVDVTFVTVKNGGHGFRGWSDQTDPKPDQISEKVVEFFKKHLD